MACMNARIVPILAFGLIAGCGGGGSDDTPGVPSKFLYASAFGGPNLFPGNIYGFAVDPGGSLTLVPGQPAPTGDGWGGPPMAITRDSKMLYTIHVLGADSSDGVLAFQINADGSLTNAPVPYYSMPDTPWGLVAHPTADFLYVSGYSGTLTGLAIDSATGALSLTSSVSLGNEFIRNSAVITPNGQYLYQDDVYPDDVYPTSWQITGFSTNSATGALSSVPGSPLSPTIHAGSSATMMAIDPTGKFLYVGYEFWVANVGGDGGVAAYSIDAASGALAAVPGSPFDVGGVPNSVAIDSSGKFLIVSIGPRLGGPPGNCFAVLSIDINTGALTSVQGSPFGPMQACGFVAADPAGPYIYTGSSPGTENASGTVSVLSIDQATGKLALIGEATVPGTVGGSVSFIALTH